MRRGQRAGSCVLAVGLVAALGACGGDGGNGNNNNPVTVTPTPVPCTQTTVDRDSDSIPSRTFLYFDFSVPDTGRLDVTLDWTFTTSPVGFYLVPANTCNTVAEFNARSCNFLVRSEPSSQKPKKISTPNFAAGNYRWIIGNFADVQESVSYAIVLSKGECPALAGGAPAASGEATGSLPSLERAQGR